MRMNVFYPTEITVTLKSFFCSLMRGKSIVLLFTFVFSATSSFSQTAYDTNYKTSYYDQKLTLFRLLPDTKGEIIFLGNSITDIGEWSEIWNNSKVKNRGISSDNTFGVLARLDEITSSKPKKIFVMIGINDIAKGIPDSIIIANHQNIYNQIRIASPATKIYVQSILPTNADFTEFVRHQNKDANIRNINAALQKMCAAKGMTYVDLYSRFLNASGKLDSKFTNDGLHLNGQGFMQWKAVLIEKGYMK